MRSWLRGSAAGPGTVGRVQHRFIVDLEEPPALPDLTACGRWVAEALCDVTFLVRNGLPTRSKTYPAERLASEVDDLRVRWAASNSDR